MKTIFLAFFVLASQVVLGQMVTLSGFITDAETGEALIGASIFEPSSLKGTVTNPYGFYSLSLPAGKHTLQLSYVGYEKVVVEIDFVADRKLDFTLKSSATLKEFEVVATQSAPIQESTRMSSMEISVKEIKNIPALLGERDVLKAIQLLPGVQSGAEGTSGFYVRGGGPDQNLILLDGVPVYNASHLFGFFSVFNPDAINNVQLIKGGFPARYGGRLSSVLDIRMKEGNSKEFKGEGSVGLVSAKLALEGPIGDKTTFIVSGRRTYIDLLARPLIRAAARQQGTDLTAGYYFYDVNAKINHKINEKNRLFLSSYLGNDLAYTDVKEEYTENGITESFESNANLGWGNITTALRWNRIINNKLFLNTTATYSRYQFSVGEEFQDIYINNGKDSSETFEYEYLSGIRDYTIKADLDYLPNPNHFIRIGAGNIFHRFSPGVNTFTTESDLTANLDTTFGQQVIDASEFYVYAEDDWKINARLKINLGLHFSGFALKNETYTSLQPRISARYLLSDKSSVKASFATMNQFIHLLTNAGIGLPTDLWVPSTNRVRPQVSNQVALGYAQTLNGGFELSVEAYYKTMNNLIEYKDGASFFTISGDWQDQIEFGRGESYGAELFFQKKTGKTTGWIGYTLSWTTRQFDNLNFGEPFFYRYDRRHDISFVLLHEFNDRIDVGLTWVYGTGNAITLPTEKYISAIQPGAEPFLTDFSFVNTVEYFDQRNDFRAPAYHRLDVGINFRKEKKWGERTWSYGFYNAYSRRNPFYIYVSENFQTNEKQLTQVALFPIIPYVTYSFKF